MAVHPNRFSITVEHSQLQSFVFMRVPSASSGGEARMNGAISLLQEHRKSAYDGHAIFCSNSFGKGVFC